MPTPYQQIHEWSKNVFDTHRNACPVALESWALISVFPTRVVHLGVGQCASGELVLQKSNETAEAVIRCAAAAAIHAVVGGNQVQASSQRHRTANSKSVVAGCRGDRSLLDLEVTSCLVC